MVVVLPRHKGLGCGTRVMMVGEDATAVGSGEGGTTNGRCECRNAYDGVGREEIGHCAEDPSSYPWTGSVIGGVGLGRHLGGCCGGCFWCSGLVRFLLFVRFTRDDVGFLT